VPLISELFGIWQRRHPCRRKTNVSGVVMATNGKLRQSKIRKWLLELFNSIISKNITIAICSSMLKSIGRKRKNYVFHYDIIRSSSLELVAYEIYDKKLVGNVAELGVYRGEFSKLINKAFPDRKLYLFDTFEGFSEKDVAKETSQGFSKKQHDFSKTSEELVLKRMKFRENCIIKKGYFPETANGLEEKFVFVSIDVDLYEPIIYEGLKYFYTRLVNGGYIFVHDYNEKEYIGTKAAVKKFCGETGIPFFPLSDINGSAIIMK
jgi:O-methyltransferase